MSINELDKQVRQLRELRSMTCLSSSLMLMISSPFQNDCVYSLLQ